MLHTVVAGISAVSGMFAQPPLAAAFVEGQVLEQVHTADGIGWSYSLDSKGTHYTATSKQQVDVMQGIAVHFATKGKNLFLVDRGGLVHRMDWAESPERVKKSK
jgi:hypothetical protein